MPTGLVKSMIHASGCRRRPARRCRARPGPSAAPWPARPRRSSPGRRSRTPAARSRPGCARPGRRPAAGAAPRRRRRAPARGRRRDELSRVALPGEDPPPDARDQLEPLGRRVHEHQLVDRQHVPQPGEPVDELRCVGRPAADDRQLHPLTPVSCDALDEGLAATSLAGAGERRSQTPMRFHGPQIANDMPRLGLDVDEQGVTARGERRPGELVAEARQAGQLADQTVQRDVPQLAAAGQAADVVVDRAVLTHDEGASATRRDVVGEVEPEVRLDGVDGSLVDDLQRLRSGVVRPHLPVARGRSRWRCRRPCRPPAVRRPGSR